MKGFLYLLPNLIEPDALHSHFLPQSVDAIVATLDGLIAESEKGGRVFLKRFTLKKKLQEMPILLLNEHTQEIDPLIQPLLKGERWGLISDAGLPCIADPGARLVKKVKELGITIEAFVGPSSLFLALMLSGLPGQRFCFRGYLPIKPEERKRELLRWEKESEREKSTQIFIETPYRNQATLKSCLETLSPKTELCVASGLTSASQEIKRAAVNQWQEEEIPEKPAIFLFYAGR